MAGKRIDIMDLRQLFRLKKENLSNRKVAEVLNVSRNTVNGYIHLIKAFNLKYDELLKLDESELLGLFPDKSEIQKHRFNQLSEYFSYLEGELKKPGCTLEALWREYFEKHPDGYRYSQFTYHFANWRQKIKGSGKLNHKLANQLFIDFTGKKLLIVEKSSGEIIEMNVFVAILPASGYTYVQAIRTQSKEDLIAVLNDTLSYYGGVPKAIVPDNLKAAVAKSNKYAPIINKTLKDFGLHYGCVIDPTRPYAPQDKAMVEGAVKLVYQRIFYPLSKHTFFSLPELNNAIKALLETYNNYRFSQTNSTRLQEFLSLEKQYLQSLPDQIYLIRHFKKLKVQKMGYIYLSDDKHYYSVPYRYIGKQSEVIYTSSSIEVYVEKQRVATHKRDYTLGKYTTNSDHLSSSHKAYSQWDLGFFQAKARHIGDNTLEYITELILQRQYPEIGYKQALGITFLVKEYPTSRI